MPIQIAQPWSRQSAIVASNMENQDEEAPARAVRRDLVRADGDRVADRITSRRQTWRRVPPSARSASNPRQCGPQDSNLQPRDSSAPAFPRGLDYLTLPDLGTVDAASRDVDGWDRRPGARRRGLSLGLTPLVSEPSWPPEPDQAWLRIAVPGMIEAEARSDRFRFPAIHPDRVREVTPRRHLFLTKDESPALPLS